jgi:hypothetical protein
MKIFHVEVAVIVESDNVLAELLKREGDVRILTYLVEQHAP